LHGEDLIGSFTIEDAGGKRPLTARDLPLALGGAGADIPLPAVGGTEPVAWIGVSEGELFVQRAGGDVPVLCNEAPVATSQWLHDGDVVRIGSTRVVVRAREGGTDLQVEESAVDDTTEPPVIAAARSGIASTEPATTTIRPIRFTPRAVTPSPRRRRRRRIAMALSWIAVLALAGVAWFVLTLRSIEVRVEPAPERLELSGDLPAFEVGGRHLLRPGPYTLVAEKEGYRRLETEIAVTDEANQSFRFRLEALPGYLAIDIGGLTGARVLVDGQEVGVTPLDPVELSAGEHRVVIRAERHDDYAADVVIEGGGATQTLVAEPVPRWAPVTFRSIPAGATLVIGGETSGVTPITAELLAGRQRFRLDLAGHKPYRGSVEVVAGVPQTLPAVELELTDVGLAVRSEPPGAAVTVNGDYGGQTPLAIELPPGRSYEVEISKAGYESESRQIRIEPGRTEELEVTLVPRTGEVEVAALPADAALLIDGEARGAADQTVRLVAVPHEIEIRKEGYETYRATVTPRPGFVQSIRIELTPEDPLQDEKTPRIIRTLQDQELVLIEGGRFRMGASRREAGRRANETLRDVELTRPFYLATMEVTNRQFREFQDAHLSGRVGPFSLEIDHHPVVRITWEEAALYCNWLSERESLPPVYKKVGDRVVAIEPLPAGYRLPTEAEWAWAARFAGGEALRKYPWGEALPVAPGSGNYADVSADDLVGSALSGYDDGFPATAPVDSFSPNPLGLFNLGGNVAEWVHDIYTIYPAATGGFAKDPAGPAKGELHVIRGSSWMDATISELRLTYRDYGKKARPDVGFRVARYLE
jgi:formylglycine-generating enzyme required for sulfatase activity